MADKKGSKQGQAQAQNAGAAEGDDAATQRQAREDEAEARDPARELRRERAAESAAPPAATTEGPDGGGRLPGTTVPVGERHVPARATLRREFVTTPTESADAIDVEFENGSAVLDQDVYERVYTRNATTPTYRLLGRRGQRVQEPRT